MTRPARGWKDSTHRRDVRGGEVFPLLPRIVGVVLLVADRQVGRQLCMPHQPIRHDIQLQSANEGLSGRNATK